MAGNQSRPRLSLQSRRRLRSENLVEDGIAYSRLPLKNGREQR